MDAPETTDIESEGVVPQEEGMAAESTEGKSRQGHHVHYHLLLCAQCDASVVGMEFGPVHMEGLSPFPEIQPVPVPVPQHSPPSHFF